MAMSELAFATYAILRERVPAEDPRLSYQDLVDEIGPLPRPNQNLQAFDMRLFSALGEIGDRCHRANLPAISSIVVQQLPGGKLGMPGPGYYESTHPNAQNENQRLEAWTAEYNRTKVMEYPEEL